jgi:hypothetical protein
MGRKIPPQAILPLACRRVIPNWKVFEGIQTGGVFVLMLEISTGDVEPRDNKCEDFKGGIA